ncbi:MAG: RteC domain-containing protein [Rikenellaceae bacterium]|nr:RteC domain-containing protein [Rikenellaceae bacterium]
MNLINPNDMDYHTLTESDFFRFVSQNTEVADIQAAYDEFSQTIFRSYVEAGDPHRLLFALIYAEVELQSLHDTLSGGKDGAAAYLKKALALVRRMLENLQAQVPPLSTAQKSDIQPPPFRWTGTLIELVELIYGLQEIGCINDGEASINELTGYLGKLLGVEIKDILCYNTYANIKHRKNESRTYFLDKMRERLNLRMQRDDAKEQARR